MHCNPKVPWSARAIQDGRGIGILPHTRRWWGAKEPVPKSRPSYDGCSKATTRRSGHLRSGGEVTGQRAPSRDRSCLVPRRLTALVDDDFEAHLTIIPRTPHRGHHREGDRAYPQARRDKSRAAFPDHLVGISLVTKRNGIDGRHARPGFRLRGFQPLSNARSSAPPSTRTSAAPEARTGGWDIVPSSCCKNCIFFFQTNLFRFGFTAW